MNDVNKAKYENYTKNMVQEVVIKDETNKSFSELIDLVTKDIQKNMFNEIMKECCKYE